uniref:Phospholipid-transporting ATPase n=1 Tax=Melopsittacus undulatus TaxID=13146 RepID=A0A8V5GLC2_MELUD
MRGAEYPLAFPAFTWEVRANDRNYHKQFKKRFAFCLSKQKYAGNAIKTAKYNVFTFLPLNLYEQFHRMANIYFVFVILLQTFPAISTLPWYSLLFPLSCLLIIRGVRDLIDDIKWCDICVGDIVRLRKDSLVPADMLLLCSSEPSSLCYVETSDIDGETNLKFRQALLVTHQELVREESMAAFDGTVTCEEPNSRMHSFTGTLSWRGQTYPLDSERILLRGCRLRNTDLCYGLVLYAGFDTKIMRNCGKIKRKKTKLDHMMDRLVIIIFVVLLVTSLCLAIASGFWAKMFQEKHSYLSAFYKHTTPAQQAFFNFWSFTILLSIIIPTLEVVRDQDPAPCPCCFINWDLEMYYTAKDIPAQARSTSLNDQLGQIEYIFSDKTGTLTQNVMSFKKCCVNGTIYGNFWCKQVDPTWNNCHHVQQKSDVCDVTLLEAAQRDHDPVLREFLRLLALCHTVMVEEKDQLVYQAASPDEEALVLAARNLGYVFLARTQDTITISELGKKRVYRVLAMLDFNSDRKRMSVLVRDPQGTIRLYTKGADTVILERLQSRGPNETFTERALDRFAEETLRTLCLASKEVTEAEYGDWSRRHREASILLQGRAQELDKLYEEMEQNLQLLGATAIEDKLQDGVPETIQLLKLGNIKVWVLTGDKQETAVNIGYAYPNHCAFPKDKILHTGEVLKEKRRLWQRLPCCRAVGSEQQGRLVEKAFVDLATSCQAVICCRVTPKQKALMVQLVKKHKNAITLAIGDGANDVNMIKTADIGVGISGLEGTQAVQCSDYALGQFSYLQRLLFIHGRWAYLRICKFLRYFFYKTFAGLMAQVWFAFHNGFTAQPLYEGWFLALYNIFYTTYPVLSMGLLEQDVSAKKSLEFPELYVVGQQDELFNYRIFSITLLHGVSTSLTSFYIAFWAFKDRVGSKAVGDYESFAVTVATSALLSVLMQVSTHLPFPICCSLCALHLPYLSITHHLLALTDASRNALTDPYILLVVLLSLVVNTIPSLTIHLYHTTTGETTIQQVRAGGNAMGRALGLFCREATRDVSPLLGGTTHLVVASHDTGAQVWNWLPGLPGPAN